ncbi:hypothetical protein GCM10027416_30870 [Okibacterium endophyticum]
MSPKRTSQDAASAGQLTVSNGGQTSVSTDSMFELAAVLAVLSGDARDWSAQASRAASLTADSGLAARYGLAEGPLNLARSRLDEAAEVSRSLSARVERAAQNYEVGEQRSSGFGQVLGAAAGFAAGMLVRNAAIGMLPLASPIALAVLTMRQPEARRAIAVLGAPLAGALAGQDGLLANPAVVHLVRLLVSSADDVLMGFGGLPVSFAGALGDHGAGIVGLDIAAAAVMVLGGRHAFTETAVRVSRASTTPAAPPVSLADAATRIPDAEAGEPQVRVERYLDAEGNMSFAVYIAGTADFAVSSDEPFDMTSNVAAVAGADAAAVRATTEAMRLAGISAEDDVALFGHSQGGLVAARIASSGDYSVGSLVTFGSPSGQVDVPSTVAQLAVEHTDDLVPALGGVPLGGGQGSDRLVVSRQAFPAGPPAEAGAMPAHDMELYEQTAAMIDGSDDPRVAAVLTTVAGAGAAFGAGAVSGTATHYRAERVR